jgi:hypothetical protein
VRFCAWYPLANAGQQAPAGEGILQIRLASGLVDYPRGKSAMVHYEHAPDVRAAALAFGAASARAKGGVVDGARWGGELLGRHLIERDAAGEDRAWPTIYAKVLGEFVRRFGSPPVMPR